MEFDLLHPDPNEEKQKHKLKKIKENKYLKIIINYLENNIKKYFLKFMLF